jgi:hypothetical protein
VQFSSLVAAEDVPPAWRKAAAKARRRVSMVAHRAGDILQCVGLSATKFESVTMAKLSNDPAERRLKLHVTLYFGSAVALSTGFFMALEASG